jgi:hypothetical protein
MLPFLGSDIFLSTLFLNALANITPSMLETSFDTHTKQEVKLLFSVSQSLYFCIATWKTKDSALNDSKHFLASIYL